MLQCWQGRGQILCTSIMCVITAVRSSMYPFEICCSHVVLNNKIIKSFFAELPKINWVYQLHAQLIVMKLHRYFFCSSSSPQQVKQERECFPHAHNMLLVWSILRCNAVKWWINALAWMGCLNLKWDQGQDSQYITCHLQQSFISETF
jgi:hypothetical protein